MSADDATRPPRARTRGPYKRSAETRASILAAATDVFTELGYRAGSMREIARRCGVDQSTVLHHFPDKSALLLELMTDRDRQADAVLAAQHADAPEQIPQAALALARHNAGTPGIIELYTLLAAESVTPDHPLGEFFRARIARVRGAFEDWFARMADAGLLRDGVDPDFAAASFLALWEGAQLHWLIDPDGVDVVALLEDHLRLLLHEDVLPST
ncbi:TetR/AcrR family transcriptional regulator [Demequina capsici]|uniref:TetR/AcrR family transcriptional regulator n=1 Tax=Demequina capsici TaxID=3075620 RepID=A0AA96F4F5_9MICO|nr:TetR/AcrR family transcriptional regulator [Demequina sp. OYTSA14]WNM23299.1 TetR/AcrR family transcriptional regulator [Demequina sp. OYTSA14]